MNLPKISTLRVLELARERITDVRNWTIGLRWGAGDANCALGAIEYAYGFRSWASSQQGVTIDYSEPVMALAVAAPQVEPGFTDNHTSSSTVAWFNNSFGHQKTLAMFDRAIANEKARIEQEGQKLLETLENEQDRVELLASRYEKETVNAIR